MSYTDRRKTDESKVLNERNIFDMDKLKNYKKELSDLRDRLINVSQNRESAEKIQVLKQKTDIIFSKKNPSIMFYGLYNAGKSTIINAIFGSEIAPTGDVPTTWQIQRIPWENFEIVDTPGINANNEHTLTADNEICLHDIILFVIDDMNIEEKSFYSAFIKVLKSGKPVLIVINEKNAEDGCPEDSVKIKKLKNQMIENIRFIGKQHNITEIGQMKNFYGIIAVNAMTAYCSRQLSEENAELLYRESGFSDLLSVMQNVIKKSDGVKTLLPATDIMENYITDCENEIQKSLSSDAEKNYVEFINQLIKQKNNLYHHLITSGKRQIMIFGDNLMNSVSTGNSGGFSADDINQKLNSIIRNGFENANLVLSQQFDLYNINTNFNMNISKEDFILKFQQPTEDKSFGKSLADGIIQYSLNCSSDIPVFNFDNSASDNTAFTPVTAVGAGILSNIIPELNPLLVSIPVLLLSLSEKKKRAEEQKRQMQEQQRIINENNRIVEQKINDMITQIMEINRNIRSEIYKLEESYCNTVTEITESAFEKLIAEVEESFKKQQNENNITRTYLSEIQSVLSQITKLKCELSDVN